MREEVFENTEERINAAKRLKRRTLGLFSSSKVIERTSLERIMYEVGFSNDTVESKEVIDHLCQESGQKAIIYSFGKRKDKALFFQEIGNYGNLTDGIMIVDRRMNKNYSNGLGLSAHS